MPQKAHRIPVTYAHAKPRPSQDMVVTAQQASKFPTVGMTLHSYKYDPRDYHGRRAAHGVVVKSSRWQRFARGVTLKRVVITLFVVLLVGGGWLGGKFLYNAHKLFGGSILSILHTTHLKGEDKGRVTILLAGNSADDPGHNGAHLTDSIMLMSIDTKANKAFLISVPRDLWVDIPDVGHAKINETYIDGQENDFHEEGYADGGMGLLAKVISENLGLPINYYALVDYQALRQAVDAVDGIDFTVKSVDPRGLYDPNIDFKTHGPLVKLTNGLHHLNGQQALNLSRARGDSYNSYGFPASDFDRTEHQRQLLVALKNKAVSIGVLANPSKLSSLSDAIGNNVKTDFELDEVRRLYDLVKKIDSKNIQSLSLNSANGKNLLASYNGGGQSALIPAEGLDDFSDIQAFIRKQTSSNPLVRESAITVVLNSTNTTGLAAKERTKLKERQLIVRAVGDADGVQQRTTTIIDNSEGQKPATRQLLIQLYGNHVTTSNPYYGRYDADFIVIIGTDRIPTTKSTSKT